MNTDRLRVWWIPQIPGKPFYVAINDIKDGQRIMDVLAKYDLFQYENNIKPDYSNAGGIQRKNGEEWEDIEDDELEDIGVNE